jgi:hypothetical protein
MNTAPTPPTPAPPPVVHTTKPIWSEDPGADPNPVPDMKWIAVGHLYPVLGHEAKNTAVIKLLQQLACPVFAMTLDLEWFWARERAESLGRVKLIQPGNPDAGPTAMRFDSKILLNTLEYWMAKPGFLNDCWVVTLPHHNANRPVEMVKRFLQWLSGLPGDTASARSCQAYEAPKRELVSFDTMPPRLIEAAEAKTVPGMTYEVTNFMHAERLLSLPGRTAVHYYVHPRPAQP